MIGAALVAGALRLAAADPAPPAPRAPETAPRPTSAPSAATTSKRAYVVAAMGDSLTDPKSHGGKYLEHLAARCPKSRFDSYGKGGNMVNQMRKRFLRDVFGEGAGETRPRYTHVIVLGGIGDILSNETAKRTAKLVEGDLAAMYEMAHARGAEVIALTLPPWGGAKAYDGARHAMTMAVNAWIRGPEAAKLADHVVDVFPLLSCGKPNQLCDDYAWKDHLHWSAKGHEVVGQELFDAVFADCE
jgi:lysophospholipase L1-like esterase